VKGLWENTPKKGDAEAWKTRTASILKEAETGEKGGFKVGTDCKGCHSLHKGK
jgi:cytochrome c2